MIDRIAFSTSATADSASSPLTTSHAPAWPHTQAGSSNGAHTPDNNTPFIHTASGADNPFRIFTQEDYHD